MLDLVSYEVASFVYVYTVQVVIQYNYSRVYNSQAAIVIIIEKLQLYGIGRESSRTLWCTYMGGGGVTHASVTQSYTKH